MESANGVIPDYPCVLVARSKQEWEAICDAAGLSENYKSWYETYTKGKPEYKGEWAIHLIGGRYSGHSAAQYYRDENERYGYGPVLYFFNSNTMSKSLTERAAIATKGEPAKSFIKLGVTDVEGNLTGEGQELFKKWLWESNQDAFKKDVIDPIIAADKADAKAAKAD